MRWTVHGERSVYTSDWLALHLADVEVPGGHRFEHHVIRVPTQAAGAVAVRAGATEPEVLLLWRHRFIPDTWGWEIPSGRIEAGESPADGAARETLEETGWEPGPLTPLVRYHPTHGMSDQVFHLFLADGARYVGDPTDASESERVEWVPLSAVREAMRGGGMPDGLSLTALLYAVTFGGLA